jgi:hypothetical protein
MLNRKANKIQKTHYSQDKNLISSQRFTRLLFELEQDLREMEELEINEKLATAGKNNQEENENEDSPTSFVTRYFSELKTLKKIFISSPARIENVIWFLRSAIFDLMSCEPESFNIEPLELYACMLEWAELSSRKVFRKHLQALLDKKTSDKSTFPFVRFFPVLSAARKRSAEFVQKLILFQANDLNYLRVYPLLL